MKLLPFVKFTKTRGLRGELRGRVLADKSGLSDVRMVYNKGTAYEVLRVLPDKGEMAFFTLGEVDTLDKASKLVGEEFFFDADTVPLPDDAVYISDLIGLSVYDVHTEKYYGTVSDVLQYGAADVIVITKNDASDKNVIDSEEIMLPNIPEVVKNIDLNAGKILVHPMKEFGEEYGEEYDGGEE